MQIIFYGLKRSGNHAIIHWILRNIDPEIKEIEHTYIHAGNDVVYFNDVIPSAGVINKTIDNYKDYTYKIASVEEHYVDPWETPMARIWNMNEPIVKIFILRDPSNCYASRVLSFQMRDIKTYCNRYKNLLDCIKYNDGLIIYYNEWWKNKNYRNSIGEFIDIPNCNDILIKAREGGGSVFSTEDYNDRTKNINLNDYELSKLGECQKMLEKIKSSDGIFE